MATFIEKTTIQLDHGLMWQDFLQVTNLYNWPMTNQIGLRHRPGATDSWQDGVGSLYDHESEEHKAVESDFTVWNEHTPEYTKQQIIKLSAEFNFTVGRVRYMRLMPKAGLTVHADTEIRFHYVLETNPYSYVCSHNTSGHAMCYHLPANGFFYQVDTTRPHFVYNGGKAERIHLVICAGK